MSARLYVLGPIRRVKQVARESGLDPQAAIAEVMAAQRQGDMGDRIVGKYRGLRRGFDAPTPPTGGAA